MLSSCSQLMQASAGSVTHEMETAYTKVHQPEDDQQEYFSKDASHQTKLFYYTSALLLVVYTVIALGAPLLSLPCHLEPTTRQYANPDYVPDPCRWTRYAILGGLTKWECEVIDSLARPILPQTSHPILPISHRMLLSRNDPLSRTAHSSLDVTPHSSYISPDAPFPERSTFSHGPSFPRRHTPFFLYLTGCFFPGMRDVRPCARQHPLRIDHRLRAAACGPPGGDPHHVDGHARQVPTPLPPPTLPYPPPKGRAQLGCRCRGDDGQGHQ